MSGFLYFLAECDLGQVREQLGQRGLGHVIADGLRTRQAGSGPGGAAGIVVSGRETVAAEVGYWADRQQWTAVPGREDTWVGLAHGCRPDPRTLARDTLIAGEDVLLGDGRLWQVPHAIDYGGAGLDRTMVLGADGRWTAGDVVPEYRRLWDLAWEWREAIDALVEYGEQHEVNGKPDFDGFENERMGIDWILSRSAEVLAANYRIGPVECSMLGLFVSGHRWDILQALCDHSSLVRIMAAAAGEQKKTDDTPAIGPG